MLSGRGLCEELITRSEESYGLRCVRMCDLETSSVRRPWPAWGRGAKTKQKKKKLEINVMSPAQKFEESGCVLDKIKGAVEVNA